MMWRDELGLVEMLFTYIGDFTTFESYSDWRPVLVDILASHEEVRRQRLIEATEYASKESMKDDVVESFVHKTRPSYNQPGDLSEYGGNRTSDLKYPQEMGDAYNAPLVESSCIVNHEDNGYSIENNRIIPRPSVNDNMKVEDIVMVKEETTVPSNDSQISEDSVICLEMEGRGDMDLANFGGAPEIPDVNAFLEITEYEMPRPGSFDCLVCGKSFKSKHNLARHSIFHNKTQSFKCGKCDRSYFQKSSLRRHLRTHNGERPFRCHLCLRTFPQKSDMKFHIRTVHYGERAYPCKLCDFAFHKLCGLNRHMAVCHSSHAIMSSNSCG